MKSPEQSLTSCKGDTRHPSFKEQFPGLPKTLVSTPLLLWSPVPHQPKGLSTTGLWSSALDRRVMPRRSLVQREVGTLLPEPGLGTALGGKGWILVVGERETRRGEIWAPYPVFLEVALLQVAFLGYGADRLFHGELQRLSSLGRRVLGRKSEDKADELLPSLYIGPRCRQVLAPLCRVTS